MHYDCVYDEFRALPRGFVNYIEIDFDSLLNGSGL